MEDHALPSRTTQPIQLTFLCVKHDVINHDKGYLAEPACLHDDVHFVSVEKSTTFG